MYGHRSIVRIKKKPSREKNINICLILICYIFINLIFSDYWLYINGTVLIFIVFFFFYYYTSNDKGTDRENTMNDIGNLPLSSEDDNVLFDSDISTPTVIAVPISPSELNSNDYTVEVNATQI